MNENIKKEWKIAEKNKMGISTKLPIFYLLIVLDTNLVPNKC